MYFYHSQIRIEIMALGHPGDCYSSIIDRKRRDVWRRSKPDACDREAERGSLEHPARGAATRKTARRRNIPPPGCMVRSVDVWLV
jgi:hypothetical protein